MIHKGDRLRSTRGTLYIVKRIVKHDDRLDDVILENPRYGHTFRVTTDQVKRFTRSEEEGES
jgi:hypothetical protein